jgi:hypothetical protein
VDIVSHKLERKALFDIQGERRIPTSSIGLPECFAETVARTLRCERCEATIVSPSLVYIFF